VSAKRLPSTVIDRMIVGAVLLAAVWVFLFIAGYFRGYRVEREIAARGQFRATLADCRRVAQAILDENPIEELDAAFRHAGGWEPNGLAVPIDRYSHGVERLAIVISGGILYIASIGPDRVRNIPADTTVARVDSGAQGGDIYVMIMKVAEAYEIVDPY